MTTAWLKRNEDYLGELAGDEDVSDAEYVEILEDLVDRAESALDAKRQEMDADEHD
jgi:hypothetical protein